ncbi:YdaU family protein [Chitinimonas sp.]|uniref:YdaU family protein n=1 Tax=Chitinimonas sp. TaxID=1934313 RepID=UPI002F939A1A
MKLIWYPFFVADYARDTAQLSMLEDGAYRRLLDHYYLTGQPLPTTAVQLHRICRAVQADEQAAVDAVVAQFFTLGEQGWTHQRVEAELRKNSEISKKRSSAALKRHGKLAQGQPAAAEQISSALQVQLPVQTQSQSQIPTPSLATAGASAGQPLPADFTPGPAQQALAHNLGLDLAAQLALFRDYYTASDERLVDWQAKFSGWLRRAPGFGGSRHTAKPARRSVRHAIPATDYALDASRHGSSALTAAELAELEAQHACAL